MNDFEKILNLARDNVKSSPSIQKAETKEMALEYLNGLLEEVEEVRDEIREKNNVYLTDELCDIAWDYSMVMSILERDGYIESTESVLEYGAKKYTERSEGFKDPTNTTWNRVKAKQKEELRKRNQEMYG